MSPITQALFVIMAMGVIVVGFGYAIAYQAPIAEAFKRLMRKLPH